MLHRRILLLLAFSMATHMAPRAQTIDLSGAWQVSLDSIAPVYSHTIQLPSTLDQAGLGEPTTLQPALERPQLLRLTRRFSHIGPAWYRRMVSIPASMAGRPLELSLERVLWKSRLFIDGQDTGLTQESLVAPHVFVLSEGLSEGDHELTLCIDNHQQHDISVDQLAHAYTNDTQTKWNGVLGQMTLRALPAIYINNVEVTPDVAREEVHVKLSVERLELSDISKVSKLSTLNSPLTLTIDDGERVVSTSKVSKLSTLNSPLTLPLTGARLWSESSPQLYRLTVDAGDDVRTVTFGMRELSTEGSTLLVNGQPTFLRGTLECCVFPLVGAPPTDELGWMKTFETARQWGLNHLRFHSWCPPDAAFRVADRLGMYLQVELPVWSLTVGQDSATSQFLYDEFERIVRNYGNHPSLCIISCGNELQPDFDFLNRLTAHMRQRDPRHLYATTSFTFEKGHGQRPEPQDQVFITQWTDRGWVRGQGVFDEHEPEFLSDFCEAASDVKVPLIAHEIGQYAVYPRLAEIEKYTGTLLPLNLMAIRDDLRRKGLLGRAADYTLASGRLAALLYKEEVERAMKTPQQSGIQLLGLQDFPGQGTALVGLLDAFWDSKGLVEPSRFREFCAPVVPLARFERAVWQPGEVMEVGLEVANFSGQTIEQAVVSWMLQDAAGEAVATGTLPAADIAPGRSPQLAARITLPATVRAQRLELVVSIDGTPYRNRWSVWVYPDVPHLDEDDLLVTRSVDEALRALRRGRRVLLAPEMERVNGLEGKFLPVFWSPVHFPKQAGTMGLLCHPEHPALAAFPTDMNSDWQWWRLVKRSRVMVIDSIAPQVTPIVESIDNFVSNRRLAQVFETRVGRGRLLVCSFDILDYDVPEARTLLYSLKRYMLSPDFQPAGQLSPDALRALVLDEASEQHTGADSIYE